jgi:hypothetical protein
VFVQGAENVSVVGSTFRRLDGNALFLSGYTRGVLVEENEFAWLGEGAMATWGDTQDYDATGGEQPRGTVVRNNYIHELGLIEKQSSGWGQAKACLTKIEGNIMYNLPRAAINFNDGLGGGNNVTGNLIWNTCRESGDHGPINSWDRMPFLHELRSDVADPTEDATEVDLATAAAAHAAAAAPGTDHSMAATRMAATTSSPSFDALPNTIEKNLIVGNFGASQGVDNDDGSSWYDIHDNVFYWAEGFKMDYGGHNSRFFNNLVLVMPYDGTWVVTRIYTRYSI